MIPFTQYLRPNGEKRPTSIERSPEIEALAHKVIAAGGKFECEELMNGICSFTCIGIINDEQQDIAIQLCPNGPKVPETVDQVVREAAKFYKVLS
jgi:hypothetical protein